MADTLTMVDDQGQEYEVPSDRVDSAKAAGLRHKLPVAAVPPPKAPEVKALEAPEMAVSHSPVVPEDPTVEMTDGKDRFNVPTSKVASAEAAGLFRPSLPQTGTIESAERGALQGASLGFGDEIAATVDATLPGLSRMVGEHTGITPLTEADDSLSWSDRRAKALEFYRNRNKGAQESNPKAYFAGELAGGMVIPAGAAGKTVQLGKAMKVGAGLGAAAGAGYSESDTLEGVAADALTGGAFGAAGGVLGEGLAAGGRALTRTQAYKSVMEKLRRASGRGAMKAMNALKSDYNKLSPGGDALRGKQVAEDAGWALLNDIEVRPDGYIDQLYDDFGRGVPKDALREVVPEKVDNVIGPLTRPDKAAERIQAAKYIVGEKLGNVTRELDEYIEAKLTGNTWRAGAPRGVREFLASKAAKPNLPYQSPTVLDRKFAFDVADVVAKVENDIIKPLSKSEILEDRQLAAQIKRRIEHFFENTNPGEDLKSLAEGHGLRQKLDDVIYWNNKDPLKQRLGARMKEVRDVISGELEKKTAAAAKELGWDGSEWNKLNKTYANLSTGEDVALEGMKRQHGNNFFSPRDWGLGSVMGAGALFHGGLTPASLATASLALPVMVGSKLSRIYGAGTAATIGKNIVNKTPGLVGGAAPRRAVNAAARAKLANYLEQKRREREEN